MGRGETTSCGEMGDGSAGVGRREKKADTDD